MGVLAKSGGQKPTATPPQPPDYKACVAQKRKTTPKPAKGQPKVTDAPAQDAVQAGVRGPARPGAAAAGLLRVDRGRGRPDQGIKVTDAEIKKSFDKQKKQAFPKDADYAEVPQGLGPDPGRHHQARPPGHPLQQDPREGHQGQGQGLRRPDHGLLQQEQGALRAARAARPADRPDQDEGQGRAGQAGDRRRPVLRQGRQEVLDRPGLQGAGRQAAGRRQGPAGEGARQRDLQGQEGQARPARSRPSSATTSSRSRRSPRPPSRRWQQAKATIKQTLASQNQQKALDTFVKSFRKRWKAKTDCREGYRTQDCKNAPKPTPTPTAAATAPGGTAPAPAQPTATPKN